MSESAEKKTLRDALRIIFRRWPVFLVAAAAFSTVIMYSALYWQLKYTGTAFFERRMDPATDDVKGESFDVMKRTLTYRLGGREAVEKVIEDVGLTRGLPHDPDGRLTQEGSKVMQEMVAEFQRRLQIDFQVQSPTVDLVSVGFTHEDPELASKVPNILIANYIEWAHKSIYDRLADSNKFLEMQLAKCLQQLDELERQRTEFEAENAGKFLDNPDALQSRIDTVQSDLDTQKVQQKKAKAELARLESLAGATRPSEDLPENEVADVENEYRRVKGQLQELLAQLNMARQDFTDRHPTVVAIKDKIINLEAQGDQLDGRIVAELAKLPLDAMDLQLQYTDLWSRLQKLGDKLKRPVPGVVAAPPGPESKAIKINMAQLREFSAKLLSALPQERRNGELGTGLTRLQAGLKAAAALENVTDLENPAIKALKEDILALEDCLAGLMPKPVRELQYRLVRVNLAYFQDRLEIARQVRCLPENSQPVTRLKQEVASLGDLAGKLRTDLPVQAGTLPTDRPAARPEDLLTALAAARSAFEVTVDEIARLENQLKELNQKKEQSPPIRQKYQELLGKVRDKETEAARWKVRQSEIQATLEAEIAKRRTHLESVQTAEKQFRPSSPKLTLVLALAYLGGLAFGGGVVFLINVLDRSISLTEDAAQYFNVPVHGVIGEIDTVRNRLRMRMKRYLVAPAVTVSALCLLGISTLSVSLWLKAPEKFVEWRASPVKFVFDVVMTVAQGLWRQSGS